MHLACHDSCQWCLIRAGASCVPYSPCRHPCHAMPMPCHAMPCAVRTCLTSFFLFAMKLAFDVSFSRHLTYHTCAHSNTETQHSCASAWPANHSAASHQRQRHRHRHTHEHDAIGMTSHRHRHIMAPHRHVHRGMTDSSSSRVVAYASLLVV